MDLLEALTNLKTLVMNRIAEAARRGDPTPVRALADLATAIEADFKLAREIDARCVRYTRELTGVRPDAETPGRGGSPAGGPAATPPPAGSAPAGAPIAAGPAARPADATVVGSAPGAAEPDPRTGFLRAAERAGGRLVEMTRTLYRTPDGRAVAVPFANEVRPGRWLLSVEDMRYDVLALLCQTAAGDLRALVVPWRALEPAWKGLSRNGRQVKLAVASRDGGWWLQVPGTEPLALTPFLDGYGALAPRAATAAVAPQGAPDASPR
jgi:hypothetical protein